MKLMNNKKGFVLSLPMLAIYGTILILALLSSSFFIWILSVNLYRLVGSILLIGLIASFFTGTRVPTKLAQMVLFVGLALVLLPFISDTFNLTASVFMGG